MSYTNFLRKQLTNTLKPYFGKLIKNRPSGINARISKRSAEKMGSDKAINKSKENGFSVAEHFEVAGNIVNLFETAQSYTSRPPKEENPNVISIKRFFSLTQIVSTGQKIVAKITIKETKFEGNRIYSVELLEINKAPEETGA